MKTCTRCERSKNFDDFYKRVTARDGHNSQCKSCCRDYDEANREKNRAYQQNWKLLDRYGITTEEKSTMLLMQGGRCAICRSNKPGGKGYWHTDHNHTTKEVRGILCHVCNITVGNVEKGWGVEVPAITKYLALYS